MTRTEQRLYQTALELFPETLRDAGDEVFAEYLYSRAASVYGGTSQIQRNIIAKRILRLPSAD
ncbi:acyl-CoA dehydrogenase family protein [Yinghuangia aomiensis]